ncbi:hypothetical protein [Staphylococcus gallinarum]|uniref:hypothetical protein n=1 Tax=Staphylococcus gallinarum TaxID=1293 RepID=UPI001E651D56|nr:hypothetical protein [Staphylococcus gallinarum]MCD8872111.1 hypothetical protein [Staphylococcus gallinarum]
MAYEYEHRNIKANVYSGLATNESVEELQEVYGKAKAWDNYIAELRERVKITVNTEDDIEKETQKVIDHFMEDE